MAEQRTGTGTGTGIDAESSTIRTSREVSGGISRSKFQFRFAVRPFVFSALLACASGDAAPPPRTGGEPSRASRRAPEFPIDEGSWGKFHSKRFRLTVPLPDGRAWKIDDRSRPNVFAVHEGTQSKLSILRTQEDELVNRAKCEARAGELGWLPRGPLTTVEEEITIGPEAYDSKLWVAVDAGAPGGGVEGHVFLFGAFVRRCLLVHLSTKIAGAAEQDVLSSRLAVASARVVRGIRLDPPRTTDDAEVPRDKPQIRR